ncbi:Druantia anti-phage system protein DruA [Dapis sp. BLCC M172]|uniref:Druantia anti-phage system protein DruA n=1 Tax=Dapis sp. BLCC M172 TaxID=2975281 RepID=UPI003CF73302
MKSKQLKRIRGELLAKLAEYSVEWDFDSKKLIVDDLKSMQKQLAQHTNLRGLKYENKFQNYLAKPEEIDILKIDPYLEIVKTTKQRQLWAYATTFWSIPVTTGYGRRIRFLVFDSYNDKLIGIFGLSDPVIGLGIRDRYIGWTKEQKLQRLYNCMTAYILGAVPPYNLVLGSKLIALCLMFPEVREAFYYKYKDKVSLISGKNKKAHLIYIDTLGAFGKSAIYTRLMNWKFIDYTKGQSHLHITANGSWELIKQVVPDDIFDSYKFGQGPNWKMRILKIGLRELGFSEDILSIGWQRGYYNCPLANNGQEYLLGKSNKPKWKDFKKSELVEYWKNKWIIPRLEKLENNLDNFNIAIIK